jgi:hypothetical protein
MASSLERSMRLRWIAWTSLSLGRSRVLTKEQVARYEEAIRGGRFFTYQGKEYQGPLVTVDGRWSVGEWEEEVA